MGTEDAGSDVDDVGYVYRSKYRRSCIEHLCAQGKASPSEIADEASLALSHVSRALSELQDRGLVMLVVSEDQTKHRLYDVTRHGVEVFDLLRTVESFENYTSVAPADFSHQELLSFLRNSVGESLRSVVCAHGRDLEICYPDADLRRRFEEDAEYRRGVLSAASEAWDRTQEEREMVETKRFLFYGFTDLFCLLLVPDLGRFVTVTMDPDVDLVVPSFPERCLQFVTPATDPADPYGTSDT